jgi:hypothetical protein
LVFQVRPNPRCKGAAKIMITASLLSFFALKGGEGMNMKFGGMGLKNMIVCALFTMVFIVVVKTILIKHPISGVTEMVNAV